jgi:nicotinate phosphoribosyltransferase
MSEPITAPTFTNKQLARKRAQMKKQFFDNFFLLGGWIGGTDAYKRTMGQADDLFALSHAAYSLTMRRALQEPGAGEQLIMAGHEVMLPQWFAKPLKRSDIQMAQYYYSQKAATRAFPHKAWQQVLDSQKGSNIRLPITIWGFPGGQTFLRNVPCMSAEGLGGIVSYIEPAMCRYFWPTIIATKGRLMGEATSQDAEFGLRSAMTDSLNIALLLYRYIGSGGRGTLTSNDMAEFMFPELVKSIGTIGHELMCCHQQFDKSLAAAELESMVNYVRAMGNGYLLPDLVDATTIGLRNVIRVMELFPDYKSVGVRLDSGNIAEQCVLYYRKMLARGITARTIVFEDEVTPQTVRQVFEYFEAHTGIKPTILFPGAGGWWWKMVHRDSVSVAFKRTCTNGHPNTKFGSPGKESYAGTLRVYERGNLLVVADASESIDGKPLYVKLVDNGSIAYKESPQVQATRSDATWGRYTGYVLSPKVQENKDRFSAMRQAEREAAAAELAAEAETELIRA